MTDRGDLETKIRATVRGVVYGQMDERIRLAALVIHNDIRKDQAAEIDWRPADDGCLTDLVASRIRALRKLRGLTRAALCDRFNRLAINGTGEYGPAKYGDSVMTESVLTNIESGRHASGSRRRMITVDELVVFAKALDVTPAALMDPSSNTVELMQGEAS